MTETWYVLHDDYTGPNGRTYREGPNGLELWSKDRTWIMSGFGSLSLLKRYVLNCNAALYVIKPKKKVTH